jgi:hypothetical protein
MPKKTCSGMVGFHRPRGTSVVPNRRDAFPQAAGAKAAAFFLFFVDLVVMGSGGGVCG